jgi:hypothetical protein
MQAKERVKGKKRRKESKKKIKEDIMKEKIMRVEVTGILKCRPTGKYRYMQNIS